MYLGKSTLCGSIFVLFERVLIEVILWYLAESMTHMLIRAIELGSQNMFQEMLLIIAHVKLHTTIHTLVEIVYPIYTTMTELEFQFRRDKIKRQK